MPKSNSKLELNGIEHYQIDIDIRCEMNLEGWLGEAEPEDYIQNYSIEITLNTYLSEDSDEKTVDVIGDARCSYLSGYDPTGNIPIDLRDTADSDSGDLLTAIAPITDKDGMLLDDFCGSDVLYIDRFFIKPQYRGKGIGKYVFPMILDIIGRGSYVQTIIPAPLDDSGHKRINKEDPRYKTQLKIMTDFIKKLDFDEIDEENRVWIRTTM
jgi:GNAT superfamily N-acetyltransferase